MACFVWIHLSVSRESIHETTLNKEKAWRSVGSRRGLSAPSPTIRLLSVCSLGSARLYRDTLTTFEKLPFAGFTFELAFIDYDLAAGQHGLYGPLDGPAFVGAVIDIHVV